MDIHRAMITRIEEGLQRKNVLILLGPRQVGKTTLLRHLLKQHAGKSLWLNADEGDIRQALTEATTSSQLLAIIGAATLIIVDEAQRVPDIGLKLKLLADTTTHLKIIATGSSSFELQNRFAEPLTGRKRELFLLPLSHEELVSHHGVMEEKRLLRHRLVYGTYPEVVSNPGYEREVLQEIGNSYLYKDLLMYDGIKKSGMLEKLLRSLAFQLGHEVNYHELAKTIGNIDPATVEKYVDLLEKAYVVYRLPAFNRNLRNEIKKGKKIYFYDNGIRNMIISNYTMFDNRLDRGGLWENFLLAERMKYNAIHRLAPNRYFWRTHDQAELDYIEEADGVLTTFEFKLKNHKVTRMPASFATAYPQHTFSVIDEGNYLQFIANNP